MAKHINIAIDGPAGAGKSTIAKRISKEMGFQYVDTGAMYRAIGLFLLRNGIASDDEKGINAAVNDADIEVKYKDGKQYVYIGKEDVSELIRTEEVGNMASACSVFSEVRSKLVKMQQKIGREYEVVMDGRDIGTVVLPDAEVKIFLTADSHTRAVRRFKELSEKGLEADIDEIERSIKERDERDMNRANSPLKQADDAIFLDSSDLSIDEVVSEIRKIIKEKTNG